MPRPKNILVLKFNPLESLFSTYYKLLCCLNPAAVQQYMIVWLFIYVKETKFVFGQKQQTFLKQVTTIQLVFYVLCFAINTSPKLYTTCLLGHSCYTHMHTTTLQVQISATILYKSSLKAPKYFHFDLISTIMLMRILWQWHK